MKKLIDIEATIPELADAFCALDDTQQAEFFAAIWVRMREVCDEAKAARPRSLNMGPDFQLWSAGRKAKEAGMYSPSAECLMTLAAPLYLHTLMYAGQL